MSRPDEGLIHAWLDGECTAEESARIEALVASDPAWAAAVAEARGLVAASSRILGALDAVPARVLPEGSRAAPVERSPGFRVRPWMGIAAGLVLVAGTAIVLRERANEAFAPSAAVADVAIAEAPAVSTQTGQAEVVTAETAEAVASALTVATDVPTIGPMRVTSGGAPDRAVSASRAMEAGRVAETVRAEELARAREQDSRRVMAPPVPPSPPPSAPPSAPSVAARAPAGFAAAAKALAQPVLAGCWRVSAPPELVGLIRDPMVIRTAGDTLVLQLAVTREVTVTRTDDRLRGALEAVRETCPPADSLPVNTP